MKVKKLLLLKVIGIAVTLISGVLQPGIFSRYLSVGEYAFISTFLGVTAFVTVLDSGVSRAFYLDIRAAFIKGKRYQEKLKRASSFYIVLYVVIAFFCFLVAKYYSGLYLEKSSIWGYFYSIIVLIAIIFSFYKPILNAIDQYIYVAYWDIYRRFLGLIFCLLILYMSLTEASIINLFLSLPILLMVLWHLYHHRKATNDNEEGSSQLRQLIKMSAIFSLAEVTIYNVGYLILPFFYDEKDIVIFGIAMRLYLIMAMMIRIFGDSYVHQFTELYHQKKYRAAADVFISTRNKTLFCAITGLIVFLYFYDLILPIWIANYNIPDQMIYAVAILVFSNAILHVAGTFSAVTKKGLNIMKNISLLFSLIITAIFLVGSSKFSLSFVFLIYSLVYMLFAIVSYIAFVKLIKVDTCVSVAC